MIVCLKGLVPERPAEEVCKRAPELGRGLDWMTVTLGTDKGKPTWAKATRDEHRGSSQMVYSLAGKVEVNRASYVADVTKWAGHGIVGRTLKDREAWFAELKPGGGLDFVFASGKRFSGSYTLKPGEICMTFPDSAAAKGCRKPAINGGKVLCASSTGGGAVSELVDMHKVATASAAPPAVAALAKPAPVNGGPREVNSLATGTHPKFGTSPDRSVLALWDKATNGVQLRETLVGGQIGPIAKVMNLVSMAWSADGTRLAVLTAQGVEVFEAASGRFLGAVARAPEVQVALPDAGSVLIGDVAGRLTRHAFPRGDVLQVVDFGSGKIMGLAVNPQGQIGVSARRGRIAVLNPDLSPVPGLEIVDPGSVAGPVVMSADGQTLIGTCKDGVMYLIHLTPGATPATRGKKLPMALAWDAQSNQAGNMALVALGNDGLGFVSLPDLALVDQGKSGLRGTSRAVILPRAAGMVIARGDGRLAHWARNAAEAAALHAMTAGPQTPERQTPERQAAARRKAEFDRGGALARSAEMLTVSVLTTTYFKQDCAAHDALLPKAREEESRRADAAWRKAEAERARQAEAERQRQAAQPNRNAACDHMHSGKEYSGDVRAVRKGDRVSISGRSVTVFRAGHRARQTHRIHMGSQLRQHSMSRKKQKARALPPGPLDSGEPARTRTGDLLIKSQPL